jgi:hypothetical protein
MREHPAVSGADLDHSAPRPGDQPAAVLEGAAIVDPEAEPFILARKPWMLVRAKITHVAMLSPAGSRARPRPAHVRWPCLGARLNIVDLDRTANVSAFGPDAARNVSACFDRPDPFCAREAASVGASWPEVNLDAVARLW